MCRCFGTTASPNNESEVFSGFGSFGSIPSLLFMNGGFAFGASADGQCLPLFISRPADTESIVYGIHSGMLSKEVIPKHYNLITEIISWCN